MKCTCAYILLMKAPGMNGAGRFGTFAIERSALIRRLGVCVGAQ
jgi:hypothetical protein